MREFFRKKESKKQEDTINMYHISGYDPILTKNISRYEKGFQSLSPIIEYKKIIESNPGNISNIILSGLESPDIGIKRIAIHHLDLLTEEIRIPIIKDLFHSEDETTRRMSISSFFLLPEDQRFEYVSTGIKNESLGIQEECLSSIPLFTNIEDRKKLIEIGINSSSLYIKELAIFETRWLEEEDQLSFQNKIKDLIDSNFDSASIEDKKIYARMLPFLHKKDASAFINKIFSSDLIDVQKICLDFSDIMSAKDTNMISEKFDTILSNTFINNKGNEDPKKVSELIWYASESKRDEFFHLAKEKLKDNFVKSPLYDKLQVSKDSFSRNSFDKTGSETILLGGELKDKVILRKINPESFLVWKDLYDDYNIWKKEGFDYVPIEPIASYNYIPSTGFVDVYTGVLDINLKQSALMFGDHTESAKKDIEKIKNVLTKKNIEHGHLHDANFCLRYFRNKDNSVDINKKPRVYAIDFDRAFFYKKDIPDYSS